MCTLSGNNVCRHGVKELPSVGYMCSQCGLVASVGWGISAPFVGFPRI
jgi:hypothetical protein